MISNTINDDKAIAGSGESAILAGRYYIPLLHKLVHALRF